MEPHPPTQGLKHTYKKPLAPTPTQGRLLQQLSNPVEVLYR